jgi:hypothetical protein|tara:strand:- start:3182 stop:3553 length:372 start_codon:yes stop_codon:yes gene_type:complete
MKKLLITLLLISPFSFADWGDVYYCQMTNSVGITLDGEATNHPLEKFQFKLDKPRNAMVFADSGDFVLGEIMNLVVDRSLPANEQWFVSDEFGLGFFKKGKFLYASVIGAYGAITVSADCDKF